MNVRFPETVILANGGFPSHEVPRAALRSAARIICCDGAADRLADAGLEPAWVVGDLDSVSRSSRGRWGDRLVHVAEQETNDLAKAFRFCLSKGWTSLCILGATGLREDHTLANLALLADFAREASVTALTDTGFFTPLIASGRLPSHKGQPVSIFSFDPQTAVSSEGLQYPLNGVRLNRWWQAALNVSAGKVFALTFEGGPLLVFQGYP